jgi:hypothetical protein
MVRKKRVSCNNDYLNFPWGHDCDWPLLPPSVPLRNEIYAFLQAIQSRTALTTLTIRFLSSFVSDFPLFNIVVAISERS